MNNTIYKSILCKLQNSSKESYLSNSIHMTIYLILYQFHITTQKCKFLLAFSNIISLMTNISFLFDIKFKGIWGNNSYYGRFSEIFAFFRFDWVQDRLSFEFYLILLAVFTGCFILLCLLLLLTHFKNKKFRSKYPIIFSFPAFLLVLYWLFFYYFMYYLLWAATSCSNRLTPDCALVLYKFPETGCMESNIVLLKIYNFILFVGLVGAIRYGTRIYYRFLYYQCYGVSENVCNFVFFDVAGIITNVILTNSWGHYYPTQVMSIVAVKNIIMWFRFCDSKNSSFNWQINFRCRDSLRVLAIISLMAILNLFKESALANIDLFSTGIGAFTLLVSFQEIYKTPKKLLLEDCIEIKNDEEAKIWINYLEYWLANYDSSDYYKEKVFDFSIKYYHYTNRIDCKLYQYVSNNYNIINYYNLIEASLVDQKTSAELKDILIIFIKDRYNIYIQKYPLSKLLRISLGYFLLKYQPDNFVTYNLINEPLELDFNYLIRFQCYHIKNLKQILTKKQNKNAEDEIIEYDNMLIYSDGLDIEDINETSLIEMSLPDTTAYSSAYYSSVFALNDLNELTAIKPKCSCCSFHRQEQFNVKDKECFRLISKATVQTLNLLSLLIDKKTRKKKIVDNLDKIVVYLDEIQKIVEDYLLNKHFSWISFLMPIFVKFMLTVTNDSMQSELLLEKYKRDVSLYKNNFIRSFVNGMNINYIYTESEMAIIHVSLNRENYGKIEFINKQGCLFFQRSHETMMESNFGNLLLYPYGYYFNSIFSKIWMKFKELKEIPNYDYRLPDFDLLDKIVYFKAGSFGVLNKAKIYQKFIQNYVGKKSFIQVISHLEKANDKTYDYGELVIDHKGDILGHNAALLFHLGFIKGSTEQMRCQKFSIFFERYLNFRVGVPTIDTQNNKVLNFKFKVDDDWNWVGSEYYNLLNNKQGGRPGSRNTGNSNNMNYNSNDDGNIQYSFHDAQGSKKPLINEEILNENVTNSLRMIQGDNKNTKQMDVVIEKIATANQVPLVFQAAKFFVFKMNMGKFLQSGTPTLHIDADEINDENEESNKDFYIIKVKQLTKKPFICNLKTHMFILEDKYENSLINSTKMMQWNYNSSINGFDGELFVNDSSLCSSMDSESQIMTFEQFYNELDVVPKLKRFDKGIKTKRVVNDQIYDIGEFKENNDPDNPDILWSLKSYESRYPITPNYLEFTKNEQKLLQSKDCLKILKWKDQQSFNDYIYKKGLKKQKRFGIIFYLIIIFLLLALISTFYTRYLRFDNENKGNQIFIDGLYQLERININLNMMLSYTLDLVLLNKGVYTLDPNIPNLYDKYITSINTANRIVNESLEIYRIHTSNDSIDLILPHYYFYKGKDYLQYNMTIKDLDGSTEKITWYNATLEMVDRYANMTTNYSLSEYVPSDENIYWVMENTINAYRIYYDEEITFTWLSSDSKVHLLNIFILTHVVLTVILGLFILFSFVMNKYFYKNTDSLLEILFALNEKDCNRMIQKVEAFQKTLRGISDQYNKNKLVNSHHRFCMGIDCDDQLISVETKHKAKSIEHFNLSFKKHPDSSGYCIKLLRLCLAFSIIHYIITFIFSLFYYYNSNEDQRILNSLMISFQLRHHTILVAILLKTYVFNQSMLIFDSEGLMSTINVYMNKLAQMNNDQTLQYFNSLHDIVSVYTQHPTYSKFQESTFSGDQSCKIYQSLSKVAPFDEIPFTMDCTQYWDEMFKVSFTYASVELSDLLQYATIDMLYYTMNNLSDPKLSDCPYLTQDNLIQNKRSCVLMTDTFHQTNLFIDTIWKVIEDENERLINELGQNVMNIHFEFQKYLNKIISIILISSIVIPFYFYYQIQMNKSCRLLKSLKIIPFEVVKENFRMRAKLLEFALIK